MPDWTEQKEILTARLQALDQGIHAIEDLLDEPHAKETEDTEVLEGLGLAGYREITAKNAALGRIEAGCYGVCVKCSDDIAPAKGGALRAAMSKLRLKEKYYGL